MPSHVRRFAIKMDAPSAMSITGEYMYPSGVRKLPESRGSGLLRQNRRYHPPWFSGIRMRRVCGRGDAFIVGDQPGAASDGGRAVGAGKAPGLKRQWDDRTRPEHEQVNRARRVRRRHSPQKAANTERELPVLGAGAGAPRGFGPTGRTSGSFSCSRSAWPCTIF